MSSGDRFYQLEFRHRPVLKGDIGSMLQIQGLVIGGGGARAILMLPGFSCDRAPFIPFSTEEWSDWLQRSDNPEVLVGLPKIFQRKVRYEISGAVQQKVWVADGCKCMYCGKPMGEVQLTIDHFIPLESGGKNDPSNYLSACRRCNKNKGGEDPRSFCARMDLEYDTLIAYLANRQLPR